MSHVWVFCPLWTNTEGCPVLRRNPNGRGVPLVHYLKWQCQAVHYLRICYALARLMLHVLSGHWPPVSRLSQSARRGRVLSRSVWLGLYEIPISTLSDLSPSVLSWSRRLYSEALTPYQSPIPSAVWDTVKVIHPCFILHLEDHWKSQSETNWPVYLYQDNLVILKARVHTKISPPTSPVKHYVKSHNFA